MTHEARGTLSKQVRIVSNEEREKKNGHDSGPN